MEPTHEGQKLLKDWLRAQESLQRARSEVNRRECDVANTTVALGKWMLPPDAKPGEKIAIWFGDSLIQVTAPMKAGLDAIVEVRFRGTKFGELAA